MEEEDITFQNPLEDVDTGESMAPQAPEDEEEELSPEEILARTNADEIPPEVLLSVYNQEVSDMTSEKVNKTEGIEIPRNQRSQSNAVLTAIELAAILIRRAVQLQNNRPTAAAEELRRGSWFNKHMSDKEYREWYEMAVTDFAYLARLEWELGYLDDWEVIKRFPDGYYETWKVGELPFLRR